MVMTSSGVWHSSDLVPLLSSEQLGLYNSKASPAYPVGLGKPAVYPGMEGGVLVGEFRPTQGDPCRPHSNHQSYCEKDTCRIKPTRGKMWNQGMDVLRDCVPLIRTVYEAESGPQWTILIKNQSVHHGNCSERGPMTPCLGMLLKGFIG